MYRRLLRHFSSSPEDLVSEITARLTIGIQRLDLSRVETRDEATLFAVYRSDPSVAPAQDSEATQ